MDSTGLPRLIGLAGISPLGAAIAVKLASAGFRIAAYDTDPAARSRLGGASRLIEIAPGLADVGHDCEWVISTLDGGGLSALMLGDAERAGLGLLLGPGSLVIDMGASFPHDARRLAAILGSRGIGLLDAPALGTPEDATAGRLDLPLGGFPDFAARVTPLLELLGSVVPTGQIGTGHSFAALLTAKTAAEARLAAETATLAAAAGVLCSLPHRHEGADANASGDSDRHAAAIRLAVARGIAEQHGSAILSSPKSLAELIED